MNAMRFSGRLCSSLAAALVLLDLLTLSSAAIAADEDHPLVGRYEGSEITAHNVTEYDEARILTGPFDPGAGSAGPGFETVEGRITLIYYALPSGRSTLEVLRNYEDSLRSEGFSIDFSCSTAKGNCFQQGEPDAGYHLGQAVGDPLTLPKMVDDYVHNWFEKGGRYLLARRASGDGTVLASLYLGESARGNVAVLRVVESKAMETDKIVFKSAAEMDREIKGSGRTYLYTVVFDVGEVEILPESRPTLEEIATLMRSKPRLKLKIVGHTDNQGSEEYNLDLSRRRAENICAALVEDYGIETERLTPQGVGFSEPVASNESAEGQQKNRRVELQQEE
jgi:OOP family OmpA-OmpF porin